MDVDLSILNDDHVAEMLAKEAKDYSLRYSSLGLEGQRSSRPETKAKPNTRFLRHIITETKNHNEALLAKEAAEAQARLGGLAQAKAVEQRKHRPDAKDLRRRQLGDIAATLQGGSKKRKHEITGEGRSSGSKRTARVAVGADREGSMKDLDAKLSRTRRDDDRGRDEEKETRRRHTEEKRTSRGDEDSSRRSHQRRSRRGEGGSRSRSRSQSPGHRERRREHRREHRSHHRESRPPKDEQRREHRRRSPDNRAGSPRSGRHGQRHDDTRKQNSRDRREEASDTSDPLEEIIGPLPPAQQTVHSRGRGRRAGPSAMDSRFSDTYDPKADVQLDSDVEVDDWDEALEAVRDRQKWKQQGAERLRAAGFTEEQVKSWEKREGKGGERGIEDVRWAKFGEGREWDRGKESLPF